MKTKPDVSLADVQAVYAGPEGDLWELVMGEQIHVGGLTASMDLAERAAVAPGTTGVDLCCCTGAGMRFLVRFRGVGRMVGVDATPRMVERGRRRCEAEGLAECIDFVLAEATATGLPEASADFIWGEDAWCYVAEKPALVAEAARLLRPGGTVAFTDWIEGPAGLSDAEADRFMAFMKFPSLAGLDDYRRWLEEAGLAVESAEVTGRFAPYMNLYMDMLQKQLAYDALKILGFDQALMESLAAEMVFLRDLAHAGKVAQGRFVARKPA